MKTIDMYLKSAAKNAAENNAARASIRKSDKKKKPLVSADDMIAYYKKQYERSHTLKDYAGMRAANEGANAVRRKHGMPIVSSQMGDMQRAGMLKSTPELNRSAADFNRSAPRKPILYNVENTRPLHAGGGDAFNALGRAKEPVNGGFSSNDIHKIMHQSRMPLAGYDKETAKRVIDVSQKGAEQNRFMYNFLEDSGASIKKPIENKAGGRIGTSNAEKGIAANIGKMAGMGLQYGLTGPAAGGIAVSGGKIGRSVAKNVATGGLRKVGAKTAVESLAAMPINIGMGVKAGFANGDKFDKNAAAKELAINTIFDVGLGGALHGTGALIAKRGAKANKAISTSKPLTLSDNTVLAESKRRDLRGNMHEVLAKRQSGEGLLPSVALPKASEITGKMSKGAGRKFTSNLLTTDKETGKRIITNGDISVRSDFSDDATAEFFDNSYVKNSIDVPEIKRVKDANLDVCDLSDESIKTAKEIIKGATEELDGQRKVKISKIKTLYKNKLRGKHRFLTNNNTTFDGEIYSVEFTGNSLSKTIGYNYRNPVHLALLDNLDTVFGEAHYIGSSKFMPAGKKPQNTVRYDYFRSFVKNNEGTDGGIYRVDIDIRIRKNEDRSYKVHKVGEVVGVKIEDIKISSAEMPTTGNSVVLQNFPPRGNASTRGLFKTNIADGLENVNKGGGILAPRPGEAAGKSAKEAVTEAATPKKRNLIDRAAGIDFEQELAQFNKEYEGMPIDHKGGISEFAEAITSKGVSRTRQLERNLDRALKDTLKGRKWFKENLEKPLFESKDKNAKKVEEMRSELHTEIIEKLGITKNSKESAAVQWIGEGKRLVKVNAEEALKLGDKILGNKVVKTKYRKQYVEVAYTLEDLKKDFAYKMGNGRYAWENILDAEKKFRSMYDRYIDELNVSMEKMYPNHEENLRRLNKRIEKLEHRAKILEHEIKGGDEQGIKNAIDRSPAELNKELSEVRHKLKEAQQELSREMTHRLYPIKNYFRHFNDMVDEGFLTQIRNIRENPANIDPKLVGISEHTKPNSKFASIMQHRKLGKYKADAVGGMLDYIEPLAHKIHIEPNIKNIRDIISELRIETSGNANELILYLKDYADSLAGKTNPLDRAVFHSVGEKGRTILNGLDKITSFFRINAVVGNVSTMAAQVFNYPNVAALAESPKDLVCGTAGAMRSYMHGTPESELLKKSPFLRERYLDRSARKFETKFINKTKDKFVYMMEIGDEAVARSGWLTFYRQAMNGNEKFLKFNANAKDMERAAVLWADEMTRKAIAGRGIGEMSITQSARVTKIFAPFQVEVANTIRVLEDTIGEKNAKGLVGFMVTMFFMNEANEKMTGHRVGIDIPNAVKEAIEVYTGDGEEAGDEQALVMNIMANSFGEIVSNLPAGSYIANELGHYIGANSNPKIKKMFFGKNDPTRFGAGNMAAQAFARPVVDTVMYALDRDSKKKPDYLHPLMGVLPKFGGRQIEKTTRYLQDRGTVPRIDVLSALPGGRPLYSTQPLAASYTKGGDIRFAMEKSILNDMQGTLFGTWATKEGRAYIKNNQKPLSGSATKLVEDLAREKVKGLEAEKFTRDFTGLKKVSEKEDLLLDSKLSAAQRKPIADYLNKDRKNAKDYTDRTSYEISSLHEKGREKVNAAIKSGAKPEAALKAYNIARESSSPIVQSMLLYENDIDAAKYYEAFGITDLQLDRGYSYHEAGFKARDLIGISRKADEAGNQSGNASKAEISLYLMAKGYTQDEINLYFKIKYAK